jgi:hypothetical protein
MSSLTMRSLLMAQKLYVPLISLNTNVYYFYYVLYC